MSSFMSPNPDVSYRKDTNESPSLPQSNISTAEQLTNQYLEELDLSLEKLDSARLRLTDSDQNKDVSVALARVQTKLSALQRASHSLGQRLSAQRSSEEQLAGSLQEKSAELELKERVGSKTRVEAINSETAKLEANGSTADDEAFCFNGKGFLQSIMDLGGCLLAEPQTFLTHYRAFAVELLQIAQGQSDLAPPRHDHRFRDNVWHDNVFYRAILQSYLSWSQHLETLIEDLNFDSEEDRRRSQFIAKQYIAACSPSNSVFNPAVVKRSFQTGGLSLLAGGKNLLRDISSNHGMPRQVNPDAYVVGADLAASEGAVVLRTELFELIQYRCIGETVKQRPILIVPPQINKYYIFDLTPKNSIVQHLLRQGHQVFIVSWKNPSAADSAWNLEIYVEHLYRALQAMVSICQSREINLVSGCAGGLTATALQSYCQHIQADNKNPIIRAHSLLVTALSTQEHPILSLFVNKGAVSMVVSRAARKGVMDGKELSHIFAWLRPVDLVWNFWVNNILMGKEPPAMEVLFWDNDSTRLPAGLQRDFIDIGVNDRFKKADAIKIKGRYVNIAELESDFYFVGGDEDYLMPWQNCYGNINLFSRAKSRFVLSNSGHIQSILRPPGIAHTYYYANSHYPDDPEQWLAGAEKHEGSWWIDWAAWLAERSGNDKPAPEQLGNRAYPPLCPSPGTYVLES